MRKPSGHAAGAGTILVKCLVVCVMCAIGVSCSEKQVELSPEVTAITAYSFGESREPLTVVSDMVKDSAGDPEQRENLERQFAQVLRSADATYECKDFVCRQLWVIGTDISVPALSEMLTDPDFSDMARYALEQNPSERVDKALRDALDDASGPPLIGVINTIGRRRDEASLKTLRLLEGSSDTDVRNAARAAIAKIQGG